MPSRSVEELRDALHRLAQLAERDGQQFEIAVVGGAAMALGYHARNSTYDIDFIHIGGDQIRALRSLIEEVARNLNWPEDWMNDAAKGFVANPQLGPALIETPGLIVYRLVTEQLLAMKLMAWRDDLDLSDARHLLHQLNCPNTVDDLWPRIEPFVLDYQKLKASLALKDLIHELSADN